jgi:phosphopantetheine--protein transferase-like protein
MNQTTSFNKIVDTIKKEEFISFFTECEPARWFSKQELETFTFPNNIRSLAGRYLIKRTICKYLGENENMNEIEILNNDLGKPEVFLGVNILQKTRLAGIKEIQCSISHSKNFIAGMTILCY